MGYDCTHHLVDALVWDGDLVERRDGAWVHHALGLQSSHVDWKPARATDGALADFTLSEMTKI